MPTTAGSSTYHTFSFADYYDPRHMGFRGLRVINEDRVQPGQGFGTHPHRDMEIISYVLEGALEHRDSMGTGSIIRPGDVQRMSAGTRRDAQRVQRVARRARPLPPDLAPAGGARPRARLRAEDLLAPGEGRDGCALVASPDGRDGSVTIHADAPLSTRGCSTQGVAGELALAKGRHAWVHVARGRARVNGHDLTAGDGAALSDEAAVRVEGIDGSEVLVFDLA